MAEDEITISEIKSFIETTVGAPYRPILRQALEKDNARDIEELGRLMAGEQQSAAGFTFLTGAAKGETSSLWSKVVAEVHDFFCTKSKTYAKERTEGAGLIDRAVPVIATTLGSTFNVGTGLLTGLVTIAILAVLKMGRNAWCKWTAEALKPTSSVPLSS
jgi:hypothetical protein